MFLKFRPLVCSFILVLSLKCNVIGNEVREQKLHPVVLIPGFGGSQIQASIRGKKLVVNSFCSKRDTDYTIWLDFPTTFQIVTQFPDDSSKCWADNMKLVYNNLTRKTSNAQGVTTSVLFGKSNSVEWLHSNTTQFEILKETPLNYLIQFYQYFFQLCERLVDMGLERDVTVRGAPYDFRKAPNENEEFVINLKALIEEIYNTNGKAPVVLIAHSMGGPMTLHFLHRQTQEWKDKYIKCLVSLSANWGGCVKPMKVYCEGENLGVTIVNKKILQEVLRTTTSLAWQCPRRKLWGNEVIVTTSKRNYTLDNMKDFFYDMNLPLAYEMYLDVLPYMEDFNAPGVEVHCLFGAGVPTLESIRYSGDLINRGAASYGYGDGDGTVNSRSLSVCREWSTAQSQRVVYMEYPGIDHSAILKEKIVMDYILEVLKGNV